MNGHTSPWRTNRNRAADLPLTLEDSMRNPPRGKNTGGTSRRRFLTMTAGMTASLPLVSVRESAAFEDLRGGRASDDSLVIKAQGSFMVGGTVLTAANGDTFHGDHAYVQYQIPPDARNLPIVMWHGGGQFSKTWESTPDGREGYQSIFLRRGFSTYIFDQPRRGRAGRGLEGTTITNAVPNESGIWGIFRLGRWPVFFPNVQFSGAYDPDALDQFYRQQTPDTGPSFDLAHRHILISAAAALFDKIGPAILITHSASGRLGWPTAIASANVKAIICYETGSFVFPEGAVPPPPPPHEAIPVSLTDFLKSTRIPIQVVFGDNIPTAPTTPANLDQWRTAFVQARLFVDAVNRHGGDAQLLHLPEIGILGNTHFSFSDLNNRDVADQLSRFLSENDLDKRDPS